MNNSKPDKYKMWLLLWASIFVILNIIFRFVMPYLENLNVVCKVFIISGVVTFLMNFYIVPFLQKTFAFWLYLNEPEK